MNGKNRRLTDICQKDCIHEQMEGYQHIDKKVAEKSAEEIKQNNSECVYKQYWQT